MQCPISELPFDLHNENVINYEASHVATHDAVADRIRDHAAQYAGGAPISNPVTAAIGTINFDLKGDSKDQLLAGMQEQIRTLNFMVSEIITRLPPKEFLYSSSVGINFATPSKSNSLGWLAGSGLETPASGGSLWKLPNSLLQPGKKEPKDGE